MIDVTGLSLPLYFICYLFIQVVAGERMFFHDLTARVFKRQMDVYESQTNQDPVQYAKEAIYYRK